MIEGGVLGLLMSVCSSLRLCHFEVIPDSCSQVLLLILGEGGHLVVGLNLEYISEGMRVLLSAHVLPIVGDYSRLQTCLQKVSHAVTCPLGNDLFEFYLLPESGSLGPVLVFLSELTDLEGLSQSVRGLKVQFVALVFLILSITEVLPVIVVFVK